MTSSTYIMYFIFLHLRIQWPRCPKRNDSALYYCFISTVYDGYRFLDLGIESIDDIAQRRLRCGLQI